MTRPAWDEYFMIIADAVSLRMSCDRARIGAVVVSPQHRILATGYGGAPSGMPSCDEVGHDLVEINGRASCVRTVHAEKNAFLTAARNGVKLEGGTLYTTASTCADCALATIQVGIKRVVYAAEYTSARSGGKDVLAMLRGAGIGCMHVPLLARIGADDAYNTLHKLLVEAIHFIGDAHPGEFCGDWPSAKVLLQRERSEPQQPQPLVAPYPEATGAKRGSRYHPAQFNHSLINPDIVLQDLIKHADDRGDIAGRDAWASVVPKLRELERAFDNARSTQTWSKMRG